MEKIELLRMIDKLLSMSDYLIIDYIKSVATEKHIQTNNLYSAIDEMLTEIIDTLHTNPVIYFIDETGKTKFFNNRFTVFNTEQLDVLKKIKKQISTTTEPPAGTTLHTDLLKLDELFIPDAETEAKINRLKKDIETFLPGYKKNQIAALAAVIYYSGLLHHATKPKDFKAWHKIFCEILGKDVSTYKKNQLTEEINLLKDTFYYLIP